MRWFWTIVYRVLLPAALIASALDGAAQYPTDAPSLRALIRTAPHDTTKAQAALFLAALLYDAHPDSLLPLCSVSMRIVDEFLGSNSLAGVVRKSKEKRTARRIKATALLNMGHYYHERGETLNAMERYQLALNLFDMADFRRGGGDALTAMVAILKENGSVSAGNDLIRRAGQKYAQAPKVEYGSIPYRSATPKGEQGSALQNKTEPVVAGVVIGEISKPDVDIPPVQEDREEVLRPDTLDVGSIMPAVDSAVYGSLSIRDSLIGEAGAGTLLTALGIDTALIATYRVRLTEPVREDGSAMEARDHLERGEALEFVREPELAMVSFMRSLDVFRTLRSDTGECVALLRIGKLQGEQGDYEGAFAVLDTARLKAREIGRDDLEGLALAGMGDMCRRIEECGHASELYGLSIELAHAVGDRRTEARGYLGVTEDLVEKGALKEAEPLGLKGLDIATVLNDAELRQQGAALLQGVYAGLGRGVEAQEMGVIAERFEAIIKEKQRVMDALVTELRKEFARRESDSLAQQEVRTMLVTDLLGERDKAKKNRTAAFIIAACSLAAILGGVGYYRFDRRRRQLRADRRAAELEIKALRAQMNPHFLFNALNSIHDHILEHDPEEAADYLARFSKLMRQVLEMSRLNEVSLGRELAVLCMYVELERMRLEGRFTFSVEIAPEVDDRTITIPPMLLQPFVENAIWHGLSRKQGHGHLCISVSRSGDALKVAIQDDGVGRATNSGKGIGHASLGTTITKERLDLWAAQRGAPANFTYAPVPVGTRVELVLPWAEV